MYFCILQKKIAFFSFNGLQEEAVQCSGGLICFIYLFSFPVCFVLSQVHVDGCWLSDGCMADDGLADGQSMAAGWYTGWLLLGR